MAVRPKFTSEELLQAYYDMARVVAARLQKTTGMIVLNAPLGISALKEDHIAQQDLSEATALNIVMHNASALETLRQRHGTNEKAIQRSDVFRRNVLAYNEILFSSERAFNRMLNWTAPPNQGVPSFPPQPRRGWLAGLFVPRDHFPQRQGHFLASDIDLRVFTHLPPEVFAREPEKFQRRVALLQRTFV